MTRTVPPSDTPSAASVALGTPIGGNELHPLAHYFVDPGERFVVCAIPKSACTEIKRWFLSAADPAGEQVPRIHAYCLQRHSLLRYRHEDRERILSSAFTFTFVRDPLKRLASAFADKFVRLAATGYFNGARRLIEDVARAKGVEVCLDSEAVFDAGNGVWLRMPSASNVDYARGISFREFVDAVCGSPDRTLDYHWRPQFTFLADRRMDFVGRVEDLGPGLGAVARRFALRAPEARAAPAVADGRQGTPGACADVPCGELAGRGALPGADDLYDDELRGRVLDRFAMDAGLYSRALPLPIEPPGGSLSARPSHR